LTEPDAWLYEKIRKDIEIDGEPPRTSVANINHPGSDRIQAYLLEDEEIENEKPLFTSSTTISEARNLAEEEFNHPKLEEEIVPFLRKLENWLQEDVKQKNGENE